MPWLRRTDHLFLRCTETGLVATSLLTGADTPLSRDELDLLLGVPVYDWISSEDPRLLDLAGRGRLVRGEDEEIRRRDSLLNAWEPSAALLHRKTRWRDVAVRQPGEAEPPGDVPPALHTTGGARVELPLLEPEGGLWDALATRRTARAFGSEPLTVAELSVLLRSVFGVHGHAPIVAGVPSVHKTSPSGGSLHPIEAYPLAAGVAGVEAGLYHYDAGAHALELVAPVADPPALIEELTAGQAWFREAALVVVIAARFERSFWKYERHDKAYPAILLDAGHLSQTFYLACTELGLGAFVTAAVNGANAEERLGLDPWREGVIAVLGCGRPAAERSPLDPEWEPFVPRETVLDEVSGAAS